MDILFCVATALMLRASRANELSFSLPLIHQSSPLHPFYNANMSDFDIFIENLQITKKRADYLYHRGQAWGTSLVQIPVTHDFVLIYSIGDPPVKTFGVADTGSELTWLQCEPCEPCYKQDAEIFDPRQSSTYDVLECDSERCTRFEHRIACDKDNICKYGVHYEDESYSYGYIGEDQLTVVGPSQSHRYQLLFGCGYHNNETTNGKHSGVVGLTNTDLSLIGQLRAQTEGRNAFSYCYDSKNDGIFQVGNDARLLGSSTVLLQNPGGYYYVDFVDIKVDGVALNMRDVFRHDTSVLGDQSGVLIDSGSSITHLHPKAFDTLLTMINVHMAVKGKEDDEFLNDEYGEYCWKNFPGGATDPSLPEITFLFLDLPIVLGENAWMEIPFPGSHISICLAMSRFRRNFTIIGHDQLMNYNLGYDLENMELWIQKQESGCPPPKVFN